MPSNHLVLCRPLLLLPSIVPSIMVFSNESVLRIRWTKYWSFSISPSNEYSGLISLRIDLLVDQETLKSLLQHHSSKATILRQLAFFMVQLSHRYMITGKTTALTIQTFVGKEISPLFNILSRFVFASLPRNKHLLISRLQSSSAGILELPKIKTLTASIVSSSICHGVMGLDNMTLVFWMLIFLPAILIPVYASSSPTLCIRYSAYISRVTIYSSDILLSQFGTSPLFHVWF